MLLVMWIILLVMGAEFSVIFLYHHHHHHYYHYYYYCYYCYY
jgi:hypothetical protein